MTDVSRPPEYARTIFMMEGQCWRVVPRAAK